MDSKDAEWWRAEAKRFALAEVQQAIDTLATRGGGLDKWQKHQLASALSAIYRGLYTLSVHGSRNAVLPPDERDDTNIVLDPDIEALDITRFREILGDAERYPVVRPTFGPITQIQGT